MNYIRIPMNVYILKSGKLYFEISARPHILLPSYGMLMHAYPVLRISIAIDSIAQREREKRKRKRPFICIREMYFLKAHKN